VLLARARFHAERGDFLLAEHDFESALQSAISAHAADSDAFGRSIDNELGRHDDVLTHWLNRSDHIHHNNWLWRVRGQRQILLGQWQAAAESLAHGEHWSHDCLLAPLYCLLDDNAAFQQTCEAQLSHLPSEWDEKTRNYHRMEMLGLHATTGDDADELARVLETHWRDSPNRRHATLGAALYRSARYEEALRVLNEYVTGPDQLQCVRAWPLLAMTHWQLGNRDQARIWLNRSAWWIDLVGRAAVSPNDVGLLYSDHRDWLYTNVFFAEARRLVEGGSDDQENNP
jgi:tetratricopeptide (TPR) repeat protein